MPTVLLHEQWCAAGAVDCDNDAAFARTLSQNLLSKRDRYPGLSNWRKKILLLMFLIAGCTAPIG
jgi:hypothetical protein